MSECFDTFHVARDEINHYVEKLLRLSRAFRDTGNREVAAVLRTTALDIHRASEQMLAAFNQHIDESYHAACEHSRMVVSAVLAGIEIERKSEDVRENEKC